jgi:hypothetical protein
VHVPVFVTVRSLRWSNEREHPGETNLDRHQKNSANSSASVTALAADRTGPNKRPRRRLEFVHVCIGDASWIAFSRVMKDETKASAVAFLKAAVTYYAGLSVTI